MFEEYSPYSPGKRWGRVHFALQVPAEKLDVAIAHLRNNRIKIFGPTYIEWMKANSYYFYDPDGNLVEFWSPVSFPSR